MLRVTMDTDGYQQVAETVPEFQVKVFDLRDRSEEEIADGRRDIKLAMAPCL
ncbi:hypothetical protein [Pseudoramibacter alactolyticus]